MEPTKPPEATDPTELPLSELFRAIVAKTGDDPEREDLQETWNHRAPEMWETLTEGYHEEAKPDMTSFEAEHEGLIVKTEIPFYSLCEHHLLPYFGTVHIGYVPNGKVLGLSKLIRYTRWRARRLTIQERLTREIAEGIADEVGAEGVIVQIEGEHMCEAMRGIETPETTTVTSVSTGVLDTDGEQAHYRQEFFEQIDS